MTRNKLRGAWPARPVRVAAGVVHVAVASPAIRLPGVSMAGFCGRPDAPFEMQMIPHPAVTVFVDLDDELRIGGPDGAAQRGSVVAGLWSAGVRAEFCGRQVGCLQIRLSPVLARSVLGAGSEFNATVVTLEDLWGREATRTQEQLQAAGSWDERFAIAAAALARRRDVGPAVDPEVAFAWRRVMTTRGRARVGPLATQVGWSRERLWSRFRSQIGLTPKRAARLVRFDYAAHRLAAGHSPAMVAVECGFVDQSHLYRDVMEFAGVTPTAVGAAPWLAVDDIAWPADEQTRKG
ncbi:helix-turn-helix domain-containing protein [Mycolicibacterium sp. XJ1819]